MANETTKSPQEEARARQAADLVGKPAAKEPAVPRSHAGEKVTVACKLPNGIQMQLSRPHERQVPTPGGQTTETIWEKYGPVVMIRGNAVAHHRHLIQQSIHIEGGYALTFGVDREFFEEWMRLNKDADYVRNRLIFAHESIDHVKGQAVEQEKVKSGLEPVDPANLPKNIESAERVRPTM